MKYKAFISYSHAADEQLAPALQKTLKILAKPWYKQQVFDVFRDETNLSTSPHLWKTIEDALRESEFLIFLASPEAAQSKWVKKEIEFWLKNRSIETIIIVLTEGNIVWDDKGDDYNWTQTTALPRLLAKKYKGIPNYADLRFANNKEDLTLDTEQFNEAIQPIAATLHNSTVDQLFGEIKKQHRKTLRIRNSVITVLLGLFALFSFFAIRFYIEKRNVQTQLAMNYWEESRRGKEYGKYFYSLHYLAEAIDLHPDQTTKQTLAIDMIDSWPGFSLINIMKFEKPVEGFSVNADGIRILTWDYDNTVQIWNAITGKPVQTLKYKNNIYSAEFNSSGTHIVIWGENSSSQVWDANTGKPSGPIISYEKPFTKPALDSSGKILLVRGYNDTVRVWNAETGEPLETPVSVKGNFILDDKGSRILTISSGQIEQIWDIAGKKQIEPLVKVKNKIDGIRFNHNGDWILTWSYDNPVRIWEVNTGKQIGHELKHSDPVRGAIFNRDDTEILTWTNSHIYRWDCNTGQPIARPLEFEEYLKVKGEIINARGTRVLTWRNKKTALFWNVESPRRVERRTALSNLSGNGSFNTDGTRLLTWDKHKIRYWDTTTAQQIGRTLTEEKTISGCIISEKGSRVLTWSTDSIFQLWDAAAGKPIGLPLPYKGMLGRGMLNFEGTQAILWNADFNIHLLDAYSGLKIICPLEMDDETRGAAFSADGLRFVTWGLASLILWDSKGGKKIAESYYRGDISGVRFSDDGKRILSWGKNSFTVWDADKELKIKYINSFKRYFYGARFNTSGTRILTWGYENSPQLWNSDTGEQIGTSFTHHGGNVYNARYNHDETKIITCGDDQCVRIWEVATGNQIGPPLKHNGHVWGAAFIGKTTQISTWSMDLPAQKEKNEGEKTILPRYTLLKNRSHPSNIQNLSWNRNDVINIWDFGITPRLLEDDIKLQLMALTGTKLNLETRRVVVIVPAEYRNIRRKYLKKNK